MLQVKTIFLLKGMQICFFLTFRIVLNHSNKPHIRTVHHSNHANELAGRASLQLLTLSPLVPLSAQRNPVVSFSCSLEMLHVHVVGLKVCPYVMSYPLPSRAGACFPPLENGLDLMAHLELLEPDRCNFCAKVVKMLCDFLLSLSNHWL